MTPILLIKAGPLLLLQVLFLAVISATLPQPTLGFTAYPPFHHQIHQKTKLLPRAANSFLSAAPTASTTTNNNNNNDMLDVMICGAGPGGLLLAKELSSRHLKVAVVDPALDKPWPNNYGIWMDEAEYFGYAAYCDRVWSEVGVVFDEDTPEVVLNRPYGRVNRESLKAKLLEDCQQQGVMFEACKATSVQHYDDQPSIVKTQQLQQSEQKEWKALLVVDATGFARQFVKHDVEFDPGYQVTYGARFRVKDLGPYQLDRMVLMDYSEQHLYTNPKLTQSNHRFPSFVYVMPLADNELFLEETILVSRPAGSSTDLQQRLKLRMQALGIDAIEVLEDERAAIPMGGMDPVVPQRTLGFGATSSLVHPASGYMVARAMEIAPRVAEAVANEIQNIHASKSGYDLSQGQLDQLANVGWNAVWPADERRQRDFMHFGFELLCRLNPQELRDFFTGFFRLPNGLWEHFLSWRLSGIGHIVMGVTVWATCIPKRFMPSMLINSLPFLANRLILPFLSRGKNGNPLHDITDSSVYADARTGNSSRWEPEQYYPYLDKLKQQQHFETNSKGEAATAAPENQKEGDEQKADEKSWQDKQSENEEELSISS